MNMHREKPDIGKADAKKWYAKGKRKNALKTILKNDQSMEKAGAKSCLHRLGLHIEPFLKFQVR